MGQPGLPGCNMLTCMTGCLLHGSFVPVCVCASCVPVCACRPVEPCACGPVCTDFCIQGLQTSVSYVSFFIHAPAHTCSSTYTHVLLYIFLHACSSAHSALKVSPMASPLVGMFSKSLPRQGGLRMSTPSQLPCSLVSWGKRGPSSWDSRAWGLLRH